MKKKLDAYDYGKERGIEIIEVTEEDYYMGIPITYKAYYNKLFTKYAILMHNELVEKVGLDIPVEYIKTCLFRSLEVRPKYDE